MDPKAHVFLIFLPLLFLVSSVITLGIVEIPEPFDEFSTFTKWTPKTITILAIDNSAISPLSSLSADILKKVISVLVILDYYDPYKLDQLPNNTALLPTLFQASGLATNQMGFLDYTKLPSMQMVFGSAATRAPLNSNVLKVVAAQLMTSQCFRLALSSFHPASRV
nr:PREDICTED: fasciclin-like arabinogalactan protein 14 [Musa acuminata subsp. malaccensis]